MFESIERVSIPGAMLSLLGLLLIDCGGSTSGSRAMQDGKVIVRNETAYQLQATVYQSAESDPVQTLVESGETKEVSEVIPGGTTVEVVLEPVVHVRWPSNIQLTIDGNMMIRVLKVAYNGPMQYEITGG